jgi:hypothetical protein
VGVRAAPRGWLCCPRTCTALPTCTGGWRAVSRRRHDRRVVGPVSDAACPSPAVGPDPAPRPMVPAPVRRSVERAQDVRTGPGPDMITSSARRPAGYGRERSQSTIKPSRPPRNAAGTPAGRMEARHGLPDHALPGREPEHVGELAGAGLAGDRTGSSTAPTTPRPGPVPPGPVRPAEPPAPGRRRNGTRPAISSGRR